MSGVWGQVSTNVAVEGDGGAVRIEKWGELEDHGDGHGGVIARGEEETGLR